MDDNKSTPLNAGNIPEAIEDIRRMFVDEIQIKRIVAQDQTPAKRAAFAKTHGIVNGVLQINDDIDAEYQVGIFQPGKSYTVWARYSSDTAQTAPDFETTVGIGIKVFDVPGKKVLEEEPDGTTVDIILQNTAVFFAADAIEMSDFKAAAMSGNLEEFLKTHPETAEILDSMEKEVPSLLTERYWSCIPYKFGNEYCKYILDLQTASNPSSSINVKNNNYLAQDLSERLMNGNAVLNFYIQKRNNPVKQSIISARSLWDEKEAKPEKVATLTLYQQNILTRKQFAYGESLAYNIFRTLPEMEPVGSIAEARKVVYQSSAMVRRNVNGETIGEPVQPRSTRFLHHNSFTPTLNNPWPPGKILDMDMDVDNVKYDLIEDFSSKGENRIARGGNGSYNNVTVSARDIATDTFIFIGFNKSISNTSINGGIFYENTASTSGAIRLIFEPKLMQQVSFDLILSGSLSIDVREIRDNQSSEFNLETSNYADSNETIILKNSSPFTVLSFNFTQQTIAFSIRNLKMKFSS